MALHQGIQKLEILKFYRQNSNDFFVELKDGEKLSIETQGNYTEEKLIKILTTKNKPDSFWQQLEKLKDLPTMQLFNAIDLN